MGKSRLVGIESVEMGDPGADGAMGASLTAIGDLVPDSVMLNIPEMEVEKLYIEGQIAPDVVIEQPEISITAEWRTRDVDPATLAKAFGGTSDATSWSFPTNPTGIDQSVKLTSKVVDGSKFEIDIPLAKIRSSLDGKLVKNASGEIKFVADVMLPYDSSGGTYVSPLKITKVTV